MEALEKKKCNPKKILIKVLDYGFKLFVLLLFACMFIGRLNPARISSAMNTDVSLIKSAFYLKGFTSDIVALEQPEIDFSFAEENGIEVPDVVNGEMAEEDDFAQMMAFFDSMANIGEDDSDSFSAWDEEDEEDYWDDDEYWDEESYWEDEDSEEYWDDEDLEYDEDFEDEGELENPFGDLSFIDVDEADVNYYENLMAMMSENAEAEIVAEQEAEENGDFDSDEEFEKPKAEKIIMVNYKDTWNKFQEKHPEIAAVLLADRKASLFTVLSIILCFIGFYLAWGTKIFKKIGLAVTCVGAVLVVLSLQPYADLAAKLGECAKADKSIELTAMMPKGQVVYIVFAALSLITALALLILDFVNKSESEKATLEVKPFQYTYRILAVLLFGLLFIPGANPARISQEIGRTVSLFTSGFFFKSYETNLGVLLKGTATLAGVIPYSVIYTLYFSSMAACLGILACTAGACISVGNNKLKRIAHICILAGTVVILCGMLGINYSYNLLCSSPYIDSIKPTEPSGMSLIITLTVIILICDIISFVKTPSPEKGEKCHIEAPFQLFLMILPFLMLVFIFSYLPLWGWRYAFFDYSAGEQISMDNWVGMKWFKELFINQQTRRDVLLVLRNTLAMSGLGILTSWCPMIFAVFLVEIKNSASRKIIQTLTTIPNFISWVLVYAIAVCIFGTEGFVSTMMQKIGVWDQGQNLLMGKSHMWIKMLLWGMWKGLGWSAIMYIAAISGIDQQLYEAATVDGASRMQRIWHITLPELIPTYIVLLILSISNILSNGMDQYLVFENANNTDAMKVLDLYVYKLTFGSGSGMIPFSTVVSMFKSLVSVVLLFITNRISKWVRGSSIF